MDATRKAALWAGLFYIATFVFSIPALGLYDGVVNDTHNFVLGHGPAGGVLSGGLIEVLTGLTGIGSAFLYDGVLVPNTELGHIKREGESIEKWTAYSAMERESLSWEAWGERLQEFYSQIEFLFSPDLFVVGGGVSKHPEKFLPLLELNTPIVAAVHRNAAGIIGAASLAAD